MAVVSLRGRGFLLSLAQLFFPPLHNDHFFFVLVFVPVIGGAEKNPAGISMKEVIGVIQQHSPSLVPPRHRHPCWMEAFRRAALLFYVSRLRSVWFELPSRNAAVFCNGEKMLHHISKFSILKWVFPFFFALKFCTVLKVACCSFGF